MMGTRRVLVTGCSSGIGLAVAVRLAKDELRRFKGQLFAHLNNYMMQTTAVTIVTKIQCFLCLSEAVVATMRDLGKRGPLEKAAGDSLNKTLEIKELNACCEASIKDCINSLPNRQVDVLGLSAVRLIYMIKTNLGCLCK